MQFSNILIAVVAVLVSHAAAHPAAEDGLLKRQKTCWLICGTEDLECPQGMELVGEPGGCYTCCAKGSS